MGDVVIAGGGLAGSLTAWRLALTRPDVRVHLVDRAATLGGNHTWSFHETDMPPDIRAWLDPLVVARWPSHDVRFPGWTRTIHGGYASIASARLHDVIAPALDGGLRLGVEIASVGPTTVQLTSGETLTAPVVIDARGGGIAAVPLGWQTFLGEERVFTRDHGVTAPLLMDATVAQEKGYRFIYVLPFDRRTLLVEDTSYADHPAVDRSASRAAIARYAAAAGWPPSEVRREEVGSLPLPLGGAVDAFWPDRQPRVGLRAGLCHPTTGYSLPDAAATADLVARLPLADAAQTGDALYQFAAARWRERGFFRMLNRLLFRAARPDERIRVLARFYRRPADLIARFYAARLTRTDHLRLLLGRPPVSVRRAMAHMREPRLSA